MRMPRSSDVEQIYRLGSSPEVMRYISFGRPQTYAEARSDLRRRIRQSANGLGYWITERRDSGDFVGWMALKPMDDTAEIEIGYRFVEEQWNQGFATEAGRRLLRYGFEEKELHQIVAVALAENKASLRVMEKIGLSYDHTGIYYDTECVLYKITHADWARRNKR